MRKLPFIIPALLLFTGSLFAQTADDIIAKYIQAIGGMDKIDAAKTLRRAGRYIGDGGFEAPVLEENKRPNLVRQEFTLQGLTAITAYNGKTAWKIEPFQGKKDPEPLSEEEMKQVLEDSDFDGPLINYRQKGNKVEYAGKDNVEGTETFKLTVTLATGDVQFYFIDTDSYVPIKIERKRIVRGAEREYETWLADYKQVGGWFLPYSIESNTKGSSFRNKVAYEKIEVNIPIDDSRFQSPQSGGTATPAGSSEE